MDNLFNLLNTLFSIEITVFGIISAVILVFVQLVLSNYSYKNIKSILLNWQLILFFIFSFADLLLTSFGSFILSLNSGYLNSHYFYLFNIVSNPYYAIVCILLIFISISFFVTLIVKNISYLQPQRAILFLGKNITFKDIRNFIFINYSLEPPFELLHRFVFKFSLEKPDDKKTEAEILKENQEKEERDNKKLKEIEKQIAAIKRNNANATDPLIPIRDMTIQFIRRADLSSLEETKILLSSIYSDFLGNVPIKTIDEWTPNDNLIRDFTKYLISLISTLLEIANKEGLQSAKIILLEVLFDFGDELFKKQQFYDIEELENYLQNIADESIGKSSLIFQNILGHFRSIGYKVFDSIKDESTEDYSDGKLHLLENIFRKLGWLGERLLIRLPFEESTIMRNDSFSSDYNNLINCLSDFSDRYSNEQPGSYPLIFFDSVYVIIKKLVQIYKREKINKLDEHIYSLTYEFASFANNAIKIGNSEGACLAAQQIEEVYEVVKKEGLVKEAGDILRLLVRVGIMSSGNKELLHEVDFMSEPLDEWVIDTLVSSGVDIDKEVFDAYLHTHEVKNHKASWEFITKLGVRLGTNFGFSFDPSTGKRYSEKESSGN